MIFRKINFWRFLKIWYTITLPYICNVHRIKSFASALCKRNYILGYISATCSNRDHLPVKSQSLAVFF